MSSTVAGIITVLIPCIGLIIGRMMLGDFSSYAWTWIPIFWVPPFSIVPAILMWTGKIGAAPPPPPPPASPTTPPKAEKFHGGCVCGF